MERDRLKQFIGLSIIILFVANSTFLFASDGDAQEPYFTLVFKTNGGGIRPDYGNILKQQLARIGINLEVIILDWPTFVGELISFRDFDICYVSLSGDDSDVDPDFTGIYNENGSLNLFGYHTDMDYNETLGTGLNEWYIKEGTKILPPDSQERIEHYWAWQQYLMDKILPCLPTFAPKSYIANWANLQGYNITDGILQSWGKMSWDGVHSGQENTSEIVIADAAWSDLNPMFQDDSCSSFISSAHMDTMIYYDADMTPWPHLATNWTHITDTQVRVKLREGIKWQNDPDGNFTNEYFNAEDVYFTFEIWDRYNYYYGRWLDYIEIVDDYTIDFFIDGDNREPGAQPSTLYLPSFARVILPEHYLNQTQLFDGVTPDITHSSWNTFAKNCFGTGLFSMTH
ncbi:MAG: ABC transporter substrate-binding protein, partial [Candidatus Heimdallarchaeota archaeon]